MKFLNLIKEFNFINFCKENLPKEKRIYVFLGIISIVSIYFSLFLLSEGIKSQYQFLYYFTYLCVFILGILSIFKPKQKYDKLSIALKNQLKEKTDNLIFHLLKELQCQKEFFNRIKSLEKEQFNSLPLKIEELLNNLEQVQDKNEILAITAKLVEKAQTMKAEAHYLSKLIYLVTNEIKIESKNTDLKYLIKKIVQEYESLYNVYINSIVNITYKEIECDSNKITYSIKSLIEKLIKDSNKKNPIITIKLENFEIKLAQNEIVQTIGAVKFTISGEGEKILFDTELLDKDFIEINHIIDAHYGSFKTDYNINKNKEYIFILPTKIKDILPKVMNLSNITINNLRKISEVFIYEQKIAMLNMFKKTKDK